MQTSFPFKALISDLDGTLLNEHHTIGDFTIETLEKLAELGIDIYIATGRNYPDLKHLISKVSLDDAMLVTSNGARANKLSGEILLNHYIPENIAFELMQVEFDPSRVCLSSYQGDDWYLNKDIPQLKKFHQESGYMYEVADFKNHHGRNTEKVFYIGKSPEDLMPIESYIKEKYDEQVQVTFSTPECLEVMNKGVCKARTLEELVTSRGYTLQDCVAFGDGMNDFEMLSEVGKGCVMGNADPRVKKALPNNEIIGLNTDESVAKYLRQVFDIK